MSIASSSDWRRRICADTASRKPGEKACRRVGLAMRDTQAASPVELRGLAFHLEDSASFCAFARLPLSWTPKKSVLHRTISAIRAETWEAINRALLASARVRRKSRPARVVRFDSTVTAALM